ncbi:MAG: hypothetical protein IJV71_00965, partial [Lachnospiraceae bacterium]|nr:hypothetical protein [Lachnospiraceae bacterium]
PTFISEYEKFLVSLSELLAEEDDLLKANEEAKAASVSGMNNKEDSDEVDMSPDDIKKIAAEALSALKDYETDAACAKLKRLCELKKNVDLVQKAYEILELIDDFEYDDAEERLKQLI